MGVFKDLEMFHAAFGVDFAESPTLPDSETTLLRAKLIVEEVNEELLPAMAAGDLVGIADGIVDSVVVLVGTAHVYGIPFDKVWREVMASNMSKLGEDGKPILREDGKIMKGPNYFKPDIAGILGMRHAQQLPEVDIYDDGFGDEQKKEIDMSDNDRMCLIPFDKIGPRDSPKAFTVEIDGGVIWLPKSQAKIIEDRDRTLAMPQWLMLEKGLEDYELEDE